MKSLVGWELEFADQLDLPGWLLLPDGLDAADQETWVAEGTRLLSPIIGTDRGDGVETTEADVREVLVGGLVKRRNSDSYLIYQVWPVAGPFAVYCHVNVVDSEALPDWQAIDGTVHPAEGRHVGPGLQWATHQRVEHEGDNVDLTSVHFVFDDGDVALQLSLEESVAQLIAKTVFAFTTLKDAVRLKRADGSTFTAATPTGIGTDESWPAEES